MVSQLYNVRHGRLHPKAEMSARCRYCSSSAVQLNKVKSVILQTLTAININTVQCVLWKMVTDLSEQLPASTFWLT